MKITEYIKNLEAYNKHIYNTICNGITPSENELNGLLTEYNLCPESKKEQEKLNQAKFISELTSISFIADDTDLSYEINGLYDILLCDSNLYPIIKQIQSTQAEQQKKYIELLKHYQFVPDRSNPTPEVAFLDAYYIYENYIYNDNKNVYDNQNDFIAIVDELRKKRASCIFSYKVRLQDTLVNDLKTLSTRSERLDYLKAQIDIGYKQNANLDLRELIDISPTPQPIYISNFLTSHGSDRRNISEYLSSNMVWARNKYFFFLLALYVGFPTFHEVEKFMCSHGHTLRGPFEDLKVIRINGSEHKIKDRMVKQWLSNKVSYRCILEILKTK